MTVTGKENGAMEMHSQRLYLSLGLDLNLPRDLHNGLHLRHSALSCENMQKDMVY
jgi:hypothetical protein